MLLFAKVIEAPEHRNVKDIQRAVSGVCRSDNKTRARQAKTLKPGLPLLARGHQERNSSQRKCEIVTGEELL